MKLYKGDLLTVVTSGGADVSVHVSYSDRMSQQPFLDGRKNTAITTATTTTVLEGPTSNSNVVRQITCLNIRNIDSSSNDVTVKHNDGTTNVEVYKMTLPAGQQLQWTEQNGWQQLSTTASGAVLYTATATTANSAADTLANVAGLSHAVDAGDTYEFYAECFYLADATTSGSRWTINGPAASAGTAYRSNYGLTATSETVNNGLAAVQLPAAANATSPATTGNVAIVQGKYIPSTAGTFAIQFAAEAGTITAQAGSILEIRKVIDA